MAAALPALQIAGTIFAAYGAIRQGEAQSSAAKFNAQVAQQNADAAAQQGDAAQQQQRRDAMRKLGLLQANFGASGLDPSTGSPLDVFADSVANATLDNQTVKYNYQMKALGYQNSASLDSAEADNATTSGYLSAAGTLLGGAGKAYQTYKGTGMPVGG
jgi:hypothetical protein